MIIDSSIEKNPKERVMRRVGYLIIERVIFLNFSLGSNAIISGGTTGRVRTPGDLLKKCYKVETPNKKK